MKTNSKRIHSITIKRLNDYEGATSDYLGEYSDTRTSEFSIDRRHTLDCASVKPASAQTVDKLERAVAYLEAQRQANLSANDSLARYRRDAVEHLSNAQDILVDAQDMVMTCDCGERGDAGRNEYRYFNPSHKYVDANADEIRKYVLQDYQRMQQLNAGNWSYIGIRADAEIEVAGVLQTVTSGGLFGVESDDDSYLAEVSVEQLTELRSILGGLGFNKRAIATACKSVTTEVL